MRGHASDLHAPGSEFHHHEDIVGDQAVPCGDLYREKVRGG
jgi:hypothetical protein